MTVLVSGTFDLLHSGHVRFFEEAATYGALHVGVGSDQTVQTLKGRPPLTSETERLYMVGALACVEDAFVSTGSGLLDFEPQCRALRPDVFVVNEDGHHPSKRALCKELGTRYVVLPRTPSPGLAARSTTDLRKSSAMPFRIDLCGGWLDQPFVSRHHPGSVITVSLEPTVQFNDRSGMASSTRRKAIEIWGRHMPSGETQKLARLLFAYDNPPGTTEVSGSQDAIGLVYPGLARGHYDNAYWPHQIDHLVDEASLQFVEDSLYLIPLDPRFEGYAVLNDTHIGAEGAQALARAADACWQAIAARDTPAFGKAIKEGLDAQVSMFPSMITPQISDMIKRYADTACGWKISGAGGGGYLILVCGDPIDGATRVKVRRPGH
ncbi:MAG: cytidyltransferase-like protein [Rhodothermales bacterium]